MPKLTDKIKNPTAVLDTGKRSQPLWEGPSGNGPNGGITFSMLSRYLVCKERFRIQYLEGLQVREGFNHRLEFGNMWHVCEEAIASERRHFGEEVGTTVVEDMLTKYAVNLTHTYPLARQEIDHWYKMCLVEFNEYLKYWRKQPEQQQSTTLLQEQVFDVPYKLPSGRTVRLRGKWDRVDLLDGKIYLGENKTKSQIDNIKIKRQLTFDLQTMLYVIAVNVYKEQRTELAGGRTPDIGKDIRNHLISHPITGVKYNVVRRSAHKSPESMLKKIREDIADGRGGEWFARWTVDITQDDIQIFKEQCFNELLEEVSDWYAMLNNHAAVGRDVFRTRHYRMPNGIYNPLTEGGQSEYDHYLSTGSMEGLERTETLFRELQS